MNTSWIYCVYNRNACSGDIELFTCDEVARLGKSVGDRTRPDVSPLFVSTKNENENTNERIYIYDVLIYYFYFFLLHVQQVV